MQDGSKPDPLGLPDYGSGYYSKNLEYKKWYEFNKAIRIHQNQLESIPFIMIWTLLAGVCYPTAAAITGGIYILARFFYLIGYSKAPKFRSPGFLLSFLSTLGLVVIACLSAFEIITQADITTVSEGTASDGAVTD